MFSRTRKTDARSIPSIVSADAAVTGNISSDGDIQIEGRVTGDVACKRMTLGTAATVEGRIECDTVHVYGAVNGEIDAETVVVSATAKIAGDIHHESISVEMACTRKTAPC
jgi:cytoskeletal protein CcmA (bactofilin family)